MSSSNNPINIDAPIASLPHDGRHRILTATIMNGNICVSQSESPSGNVINLTPIVDVILPSVQDMVTDTIHSNTTSTALADAITDITSQLFTDASPAPAPAPAPVAAHGHTNTATTRPVPVRVTPAAGPVTPAAGPTSCATQNGAPSSARAASGSSSAQRRLHLNGQFAGHCDSKKLDLLCGQWKGHVAQKARAFGSAVVDLPITHHTDEFKTWLYKEVTTARFSAKPTRKNTPKQVVARHLTNHGKEIHDDVGPLAVTNLRAEICAHIDKTIDKK